MDDQITIDTVATCHEKNRRDRRELPLDTDLTHAFRVADIWRSFVVQRILWTNGWGVLHHEPTLFQERSPHDLLRDFESEVPGYLHNGAICEALGALPLKRGQVHLLDNLRIAYEALVVRGHLLPEELERLEAWIADIVALTSRTARSE